MIDAVWQVEWTEMVRNYGQRFSHNSYHETEELAKKKIKEYWDSMPNGDAPDYYLSPGTPKLVERKT